MAEDKGKILNAISGWLEIKNNNYLNIPLFLFSFLIPFWLGILPYLIWLIAVFWIWQEGYKNRFKNIHTNKENSLKFWMCVIFFGLHIISLIYSEDKNEALLNLQVKLSFIVFPLILFISDAEKTNDLLPKIFTVFISGTIVASVICYIMALYHSFQLNQEEMGFNINPTGFAGDNFFLYKYFSVFQHPSYFAMYLNLSIGILLIHNRFKILPVTLKRYIVYLIVAYLSLTILLLSSRAGIIVWIVIWLFYFIVIIQRSYSLHQFIYFLLPVIIILGFSAYIFIGQNRFNVIKEEINRAESAGSGELGSVALRLIIWDNAYKLFKEKPFFGTGIGDVQNDLHNLSWKNGFPQIKEMNLNVHNQYLELLVGTGIFGLMIFLVLIFLPLSSLQTPVKQIFIVYLCILLINLLFESMFDRLWGVVFFSFFYSLFAFSTQKEK